MTAVQLLQTLEREGCGPAVDGLAFTLAVPAPLELAGPLRTLHTGCRAVLTGRPWMRLAECGRPVVIDPAALLPRTCRYLCVLGDRGWDRVLNVVELDFPGLFDPTPAPDAGSRRR